MDEVRVASTAAGSEVFALIAVLVICLLTLLILRYYLPLRTTPAYLLVPIFFALGLPASIIILLPIDLASDVDTSTSRGIWLPERVLLVSWKIAYWLIFALTWFILPILAEYSDAGYREPQARVIYSLRENAQYQAMLFGAGLLGMIYVFVTYGATPTSLKGLVMALAYCWGLVLAIYLMGHGLVAIPRSLFRNASASGRLRRLQSAAPKVHEKMEDAIQRLEDVEAQVMELSRRKTGSAARFRDWIEELADLTSLPESRPRTLSRRLSEPHVSIPAVITEGYMADITRQLFRARHARVRYIDEWTRLVKQATDTQAILDSAASKRLEIAADSPDASFFERFTVFTPYSRYMYYAIVIPYLRLFLGAVLTLASASIIWTEVVKRGRPSLSIISLTVVHHPGSEKGQIGFPGQMIAAFWILYMCAAALSSLTEVKVWRGRALVRRNTAYESAFWYSMQVAKLTVPLAYNFLTFLPEELYIKTTFYAFLGQLINLTPLGSWFDTLFPIFILVPVSATLFNLYGKVKRLVGFGDWVDDSEDEENPTGYGTSSWREGRDLIERELHGHSSLSRLRGSSPLPSSRVAATQGSTGPARHERVLGSSSQPRSNAPSTAAAGQAIAAGPEDENFLESFGHRVRNTIDTMQTPRWMQNLGDGIKKPKWMGGDGADSGAGASGSGAGNVDFTRWFGGRGGQEGRVRLL